MAASILQEQQLHKSQTPAQCPPDIEQGNGETKAVTRSSEDQAQDADSVLPEASAQANEQHWWDRLEPYVLIPTNRKQWMIFLGFWSCIVGLAVWFIIWAFPRIVDSAFDPAVERITTHLTRVQIGVLISTAVMLLPLTIILPKEPAVWVAAIVFNFGEAFAVVMSGLIPGMAIAFLLTHFWFKQRLMKFFGRYRYTNAILLGIRKAGTFNTTIILRLGPVPQPIVSYLLGLPEGVSFLQYMAGSILGSIPGVALGVIFGRNIKGLSAMIQGEKLPASQVAVNLVSLGAAIVLLVAGYIYAKRSLSQLEEEAKAQADPPSRTLDIPPPPLDSSTTDSTTDVKVVIVQAIPLDMPPYGMGMASPTLGVPRTTLDMIPQTLDQRHSQVGPLHIQGGSVEGRLSSTPSGQVIPTQWPALPQLQHFYSDKRPSLGVGGSGTHILTSTLTQRPSQQAHILTSTLTQRPSQQVTQEAVTMHVQQDGQVVEQPLMQDGRTHAELGRQVPMILPGGTGSGFDGGQDDAPGEQHLTLEPQHDQEHKS